MSNHRNGRVAVDQILLQEKHVNGDPLVLDLDAITLRVIIRCFVVCGHHEGCLISKPEILCQAVAMRRELSTTSGAATAGGSSGVRDLDEDPTLFEFLQQGQEDARQGQSVAAAVPVPAPEELDEDLQVEITPDSLEVHLLETWQAYATEIKEDLASIKETDATIAQHIRATEIRERDLTQTEKAELLAGKSKEWQKLLATGAIKVYSGAEAEITQKQIHPSRILKSRFVKTRRQHPKLPGKTELKARWRVKGYLYPDVCEPNKTKRRNLVCSHFRVNADQACSPKPARSVNDETRSSAALASAQQGDWNLTGRSKNQLADNC